MHTVQVKKTIIGEGRPKICVPIVAKTAADILAEAKKITALPVDIVEWRADCFDDVALTEKVIETAGALQDILQDIPLLFTFRSAKEGGEKEISAKDYAALNIAAAQSGYVDLIDVEAFTGDETVQHIITAAHDAGVRVIASNHDFFKTPAKEEIVRRLRFMQDMNADISKIAVMPACRQDVLTLLLATLEMTEKYADRPIITMSMAGTGVVSRLVGESFGSALTFGAASQASAPGQIDVEQLRQVLDIIHESL